MKQVSYFLMERLHREAIQEAAKVIENAHSPYSHFYVGACLFTADGKLVAGTNFENAAHGSMICAERAAVLRANAMGIRQFRGIAIIARGEDFDTTEVIGPCGSCRQVLYEVSQISDYDLEVILATSKKDKIILTTISELLPLASGPLDLGMDTSRYQK
ncbi:MAG: cytidine deaminase [Patescibacteria group bacterium]|nr:MAG: cytidine deaminase [Patescibacteria group bacterium]